MGRVDWCGERLGQKMRNVPTEHPRLLTSCVFRQDVLTTWRLLFPQPLPDDLTAVFLHPRHMVSFTRAPPPPGRANLILHAPLADVGPSLENSFWSILSHIHLCTTVFPS